MRGVPGQGRERLLDGAVEAAARYGYGGASVARIVKAAGVSRATFYEHFEDREACFLAAYRRAVHRAAECLPGDSASSRREVVEALLAATAAAPADAQLILLESLAGPAAVRSEHRSLLDSAELAVACHLDRALPGEALQIPPRALLGGLVGVVCGRMLRGEAGDLEALLDEILAWVGSYTMSQDEARLGPDEWAALGAGLEGGVPDLLGEAVLGRRLPRGRGAVAPSLVTGEQRKRILAAVARLAREVGYDATTVAAIVSTAGTTRAAFYEHFRGKEDAFLAAQSFALEQSIALTARRFFSDESWPDRAWSGLGALLGFVAGQRDLVYVELVESYAAGPAAIRRSAENRSAFTLFLEDGYRLRPEAEALPRLCSEAIAAAVNELMRREVAEGRGGEVMTILPQAVYVAVAPFIGPAAALRMIGEKTGRPIRR